MRQKQGVMTMTDEAVLPIAHRPLTVKAFGITRTKEKCARTMRISS